MTDPLIRNQPPHHHDAERAVLGAVLCRDTDGGTGVLDLLADSLKPSHFYSAKHAAGYEAMLSLWSKGQPVDELTLADELQRRGGFDNPHAEVAEWLDSVPSPSNAEHYASRIVDASVRRETLLRAAQIQSAAYSWTGTREAWVAYAEATLQEATAQGVASNEATAAAAVIPVRDYLVRVRDGLAEDDSIRTGYPSLDRRLGGMVPGQYVCIAGRPSQGKSSLAINILSNLALANVPVGMFSLEMPTQDVLINMACSMCGVDGTRIRRGEASLPEWSKAFSSLDRLRAHGQLVIDDTPTVNAIEFRARARRWVSRYGVRVLCVDYLQLMHGPAQRKGGSREQEVSEISRTLKAVARELRVVVLALAQLNRESEKSVSKVPQLGHLRESGGIEQDLDVCLLVHRPEYYDRENEDLKGKASVIVAKNRNGATGEVAFRFDGRCFRFLEDEEANNRRGDA